ncbi:MAG TPA: hypothetical protein VFF67_04730 [Thermoplasmata archaeon]|nr:hypothetical protein [Thermoplasmata archaeon]
MSEAVGSELAGLRLERTVRYVVYLTAGLGLLAVGIPRLLTAASALALCLGSSAGCFSPPVFGSLFLDTYAVDVAGSIVMVVIAVVFLLMARAVYRHPLVLPGSPAGPLGPAS